MNKNELLEPNAQTHKTVRVFATMETDLELDINVPINLDNDEIWEFIANGNIDSGNMIEDQSPGSGAWTWDEPCYEMEFDPNAINYSKEIMQLYERMYNSRVQNIYPKRR